MYARAGADEHALRTRTGLLVSVLIFQQGWGLLMTALRQLTDAGVSPATRAVLLDALQPLLPANSISTPSSTSEPHSNEHAHTHPDSIAHSASQSNSHEHEHHHEHAHAPAHEHRPASALMAVSDVRAMRTGANMFVDLTAHVPRTLSVADAEAVERAIREALVRARRDVKEVRVRFRGVREDA